MLCTRYIFCIICRWLAYADKADSHAMDAFSNDSLTLTLLLKSIIKIAFSTTFAGLVWCIGYIGYNHFKGTEDPDWAAIEERWRAKHTLNEDKMREKEV